MATSDNEPKSGDEGNGEDPWQQLSPEERKRAERHLIILYIVMGTMVVAPFVFFYFFRK
jgi:hypothetical protein